MYREVTSYLNNNVNKKEDMASHKVRSWMVLMSVVFIFMLNSEVRSGLANTTINCMGAAIPGEKTTLSCEITGTVGGGIQWLRPNNGTTERFIDCSIANDECGQKPGYSIVIDPATQKHTFTIDSFNTTFDAGNWTCRDANYGLGQTTCTKEVATYAAGTSGSPVSPIMSSIILVTVVTAAELVIGFLPTFL